MPTTTRFSLLFLGTLAVSACANVDDAPEAQVEAVDSPATSATPAAFVGTPITLSPDNARIAWQAAKVTQQHDGGFRAFTGALYLDGDAVAGVDMTIDAASIYSDSERLTNHLRSGDFFDAENIPEARFRADTFAPATAEDRAEAPAATHRVSGELTMRGQTNRITFPAAVAVTPDSVNVDANFIINRQQWGLTYPGQPDDLIRDDVRIILEVNAARGTADGVAATSN
ncbi:MAG TPA: YceI family protein [Rubricoccaceae bacterium]|nr:YceI family protein [Rubricoccaceae bacterium]